MEYVQTQIEALEAEERPMKLAELRARRRSYALTWSELLNLADDIDRTVA